MFATKKDIESWCKEFLIKNDSGQFLCPFENEPVTIVKAKGCWKISGKDENWLWDVEDIKQGQYDENEPLPTKVSIKRFVGLAAYGG